MTWISWRNRLATATLSSTRSVAGLTVDKLKNPVVAERYRAADLAPGDTKTEIKIEWPASYRPGVIAYVRPRRRAVDEAIDPPSFAATDLVRHKFSSADTHTGDVYLQAWTASAVEPGYGYHCFFPPAGAATAFASFEFDALSRATAPNNFVDWGYAHYGDIELEPEIGYASPASFGWQEGATRQLSWDGSALRIRRKRARRRWRLVFRSIRWPSERAAVEDFLEYAGDGGRFLMGLDRTDLSRGVMVAVLDQSGFSRTTRKFGQLELPVLEAI